MSSRAKLTLDQQAQEQYTQEEQTQDNVCPAPSKETNPEKKTEPLKKSNNIKKMLYFGALIASLLIFKRKIF